LRRVLRARPQPLRPLEEVAAGPGAVLPSAALARMRAQELKALAHSELVALLGLSKKPVGRPTAERIAREGMLGPLEDAFTAACTNGVVATFADWWPDKARRVYELKGWRLHGDMIKEECEDDEDGEGMSVVVVGDDEEGAEKGAVVASRTVRAVVASRTVRLIYRSLCHKWDVRGGHAGWHTRDEVGTKILNDLGHKVAPSTASRYLAKEKELYAKNDPSAVMKKPNLVELINLTRSEEKELKVLMITDEPRGRPHEFPPEWYPLLSKRCSQMQKLLGFGSHIVQAFANLLHAEMLEVAPEEVRVPSEEWCYWFMHTQMGLTPRRITSHACTPQQVEEQERLKYILTHINSILRAFSS
jgi:hypothetical protein